jgi:hypothetical protein
MEGYLPNNPIARERILQRVKSSKRLEKIMQGLDREGPCKNDQLAANLLFSSPLEKYTAKDIEGIKEISVLPPTQKNYEKVLGLLDHKNMSSSIHSALDNVYKYDSELKRCENGGMNLATIMTEYRRKQLMEALLFENECDDPYEGRDKLKIYLATNHPELLENDNKKDSPNNNNKTEELTIKLEKFPKRKQVKGLQSSNNEFIPKWGSYDTMKNRWQYIRPQLKQLKHENDMYAPVDAARSYVIKEGETTLKLGSSYQDGIVWSQRSFSTVKKSSKAFTNIRR